MPIHMASRANYTNAMNTNLMTSRKIKICGLSNEPTLRAALDAGADYIGLVFYPPSPRHVELDTARQLADLARGRAKIVALFVDPDDDLLRAVISAVKPDLLQLHGNETPQRVAQISRDFQAPVMKAIKVRTAADASAAKDYAASGALVLFDAKAEVEPDQARKTEAGAAGTTSTIGTLPGGNGVAFDWSALNEVKSQVAFMLSGGLNPDNIALAIAATGAGAVDVSSGVESAPGVKDSALITKFIHAAKTASGSFSEADAPLAKRFDPP